MKEEAESISEFIATEVEKRLRSIVVGMTSETVALTIEKLHEENQFFRAKLAELGNEYAIVSHFKEENQRLRAEREEMREALGSFEKLYVAAEDGEMLQDCCKKLNTTLMHGDFIFRVNYTKARFVDQVLLKSQGSRVGKLVETLKYCSVDDSMAVGPDNEFDVESANEWKKMRAGDTLKEWNS